MIAEIWRPCPGFECYYEVSDQGRVRRSSPGSNATKPGRILTPQKKKRSGHLRVRLNARPKCGTRSVHRLVAEAFLGPPPSPAHEVAHANGNPSDNAAGNLRWATHAENMQDMVLHGRVGMCRGRRNGMTKLTEWAVRDIRRRVSAGDTLKSVAADYRVTEQNIHQIAARKSWAWLD